MIEARLAETDPDATPHPYFNATYTEIMKDWLNLYRKMAENWKGAQEVLSSPAS